MNSGRSEAIVAVPLKDIQELIAKATQRWMDLETASEYTGLSTKTIRRAINKGDLAVSRVVKGKGLLDRRAIDAWILGGME